MRGQWTSYDNFNLIDLIDEVKTRVNHPSRVDDILHGAMIVGKDYKGTCEELRNFLKDNDLKDGAKYDIDIIAQNMTRDEFLIKVKNEVWCISKYGFNDSHDHCAVIMGGDCIECFKDAVKNIRFKGE